MIVQTKNNFYLKLFALLLTAMICHIPDTVIGQGNSFFIGATGGVNLSKFKFKDQYEDWDVKSQIGFKGGVTLGVDFNRLSIVTGLNFTKKSSRFITPNGYFPSFIFIRTIDGFDFDALQYLDTNQDGLEDYGFFNYRETHNYVSVPLVLRMRLFGEESGVTIGTGLSFNFGISADISGDFQAVDIDSENFVKTTNISSLKTSADLFYDNNIVGTILADDIYYSNDFLNYDFGRDLNNEYKKVHTNFLLNIGGFMKVGEKGQIHANLGLNIGLKNIYNGKYKDVFPSLLYEENLGKKFLTSTILSISYEHHLEFGDKY